MKKKICGFILCCIALMAIGLFFIINPTKTTQASQTAKVNLETNIAPEPSVEPTVEPTEAPTPIVEDEEPAEVKALVDEANGVSDSESIIDVEKPAEEEEAEPTEAPVEEEKVADSTPTPEIAEPTPSVEPTPSAEPAPTATPNPNVTTKSAAEKQAEANALIQQRIAELGGSQTIPNGTATHNMGTGIHFGDIG